MEYLNKTGIYQAALVVQGAERELPREQKVIVFRIIQESLQHIMKHAYASKIEIILHFTETEFWCRVKDDGRGFVIENALSAGGFGLKSQYSRAQPIKGALKIESDPGQGTQTRISIPLSKPKQKQNERN